MLAHTDEIDPSIGYLATARTPGAQQSAPNSAAEAIKPKLWSAGKRTCFTPLVTHSWLTYPLPPDVPALAKKGLEFRSSHRSYKKDSHSYHTPESFWACNKPAIVICGVIGLCCITYYCQWTAARLAEKGNHAWSDLVDQNLVNSVGNIREGRWWVMISSSFAHVNLAHLGLNMFVLWGFGRGFVGVFGVPCFVGSWMFSAASCSAAQNYWQQTQERLRSEMVGRGWDKRGDPTILGIRISRERALAISGGSGAYRPHIGGSEGASGVICGLTGGLLCYMPKLPIRQFFILPMPLWFGQLVFTVGTAFCMATGSAPIIGHAGHLGGAAAGIAYYYGVARPWLRRSGRF